MTLFDIRNQIVAVLCVKDTFTKEDFSKVKLPKDAPGDKADLIRTALKDLSDYGMVKQVGDSEIWILTAPLNANGQTIEVSMETANRAAQTINAFLDGNEIKGPRVDALNVNEGIIIALLSIIENLSTP